MGGWFLVGIIVLVWLFVVPVFGLIGFARSARLAEQLSLLNAELAAFRSQRSDVDDKEPVPRQDTPPPARNTPVPTPDPLPAPAVASPAPASAASARTEASLNKPDRQTGPGLEHLIAANWIVWVGGAALTLGGLFLVRIVIDAGFFGPLARTISAVMFGSAMIYAAFRAGDMDLVQKTRSQLRYLPPLLAGAGIITLYGAGIAAGLIYGFVSPLIMLFLFAVISALAVWLSVQYSRVLALIGFGGAYFAPLLTGADPGLAIAAPALCAHRHRSRPDRHSPAWLAGALLGAFGGCNVLGNGWSGKF